MRTIFLSIILPAYKEAERIGVTLLSLDKYFKDKGYSYEIIVVNDGSPDNLVSVVKDYARSIKNLRVIDNKTNYGKGYAVRCGMMKARGEYRLFMDSDNSVSISNLDRFLTEIARGSEVVIGSIQIGNEKKDEHNGWHRRLLSKLSKAPVRIFATPGIYDTQRGFKLFSRRAARIIFPRQTINRFAFDIELLVIALANKLKIKELSVAFDNPLGSTVRLSSYIRSLGDLLKIVVNKALGVYSAPLSRKVAHPAAGRTMVGALVGIFMVCAVVAAVFLIKVGITMQERATATVSRSVVVPPEFLPGGRTDESANTSSWLYERNPMTKTDTAQLLLVSILLMLSGADVISRLFSARLYSYLRAIFSRTTSVLPAYRRGGRASKLIPRPAL